MPHSPLRSLDPIYIDGFDEFIDDEGAWDDADAKVGATTLVCLVAAVLAGMLILTFALIDRTIDALPAPVTKSTVTSTEVSTRVVTSVQTTVVTTTVSPSRQRRDNEPRVSGGAGGESARARQNPDQADSQRGVAPGTSQAGGGALARTFGDGAVMAGRDVAAGTYRNSGGANCEWTFRRGNEVLDSGRTSQSFNIDLAADGAVFISRGCGAWSLQP